MSLNNEEKEIINNLQRYDNLFAKFEAIEKDAYLKLSTVKALLDEVNKKAVGIEKTKRDAEINLISKENELSRKLKENENHIQNKEKEISDKEKELNELKNILDKIVEEKNSGCPWVSELIASYHEAKNLKLASYLRNKSHPAVKKANDVKELSKENRSLRKEVLILKNYLGNIKDLFPGIEDETEEELTEVLNEIEQEDEEVDPVYLQLKSIPKQDYEKLSEKDRNQRALDLYWHKDMSCRGIGKAYERYIGYFFEELGYKVQFHGIEKGLADWGRDLVCIKNSETYIVQCKCWSKKKGYPIRENAVSQLYGSTIKYIIEHFSDALEWDNVTFKDLLKHYKVTPIIVTSTLLSGTAKLFANSLGVGYKENHPIDKKYPSIKCNISKKTGEKIYHLPFDQQYDNIVIEKELGESYAYNIEEAIRKGFLRRAWRWHGEND